MGEIMGIWASCMLHGQVNIIMACMMDYLVISKALNMHIPFVPEILLLRMYLRIIKGQDICKYIDIYCINVQIEKWKQCKI